MANLKDLIVNGAARIIGKTYSSEFVGNVTGNVTGNLTGNAATASKLGTATVGGDTKPIYLKAGVATAVSNPVIPLVSNGDMTGADVSTVQGAGVLLKDESTGTVWNIHTHANNLRMYNGSTEKILSENGHTHNYAGSTSVGGPATDFAAEAGTASTDRYVYFAYDDTTTYNNPDSSKVTKGRAVVDSDFKYNPGTNTLAAGTFKGSLSGNADTATKLKTARSLKITDDGTNTSTGVDFDGSDAVTLKLPSTIKATFSGNLTGDVAGNVSGSSGSCTGNAATATKATNDSADQQINTTYIKGLSVDGRTITYTRGDNSTNTITTQDTTYTIASGDSNGQIKITPSNGDAYNVAVTGLGTNAYSNTSYLPLSGGTMTGNISYAGTKATYTMIKFLDNTSDTYGNGISIGGGGVVVIGSGESADTVCSGLGISGGDETTYISSDQSIVFYTNCQSGIGSAKRITMDAKGEITASKVWGAVFNDLADAIPVGEGDVLEAGYCYGFDGEHYTKTSEYMQKSCIGIHSDTFGFLMGREEDKEKLNVAVSGFVLAYVDKEYEVGTPLTCTVDGCLTEIKLEDKIKYPERVVATYWKNEPNEEWGPEDKKVKVNGRRWVKVK